MNEHFSAMLEQIDIQLDETQQTQFDTYFTQLIDWNKKLNLTSITDEDEVYLKHFFDSLSLNRAMDFHNQSILDVGSGAGFPSIPLKLVYPDLQVTIIDAMQKRIQFLNDLCDKLNIEVTLIHGRAEEFEQKERFDIVTARAVANLRILSELCIPFVKVGGHFLAMKGPHYEDELLESKHAFDTLKVEVDNIITYPIEHLDRTIVKLLKVDTTPQQYPRRYKKIKTKPL